MEQLARSIESKAMTDARDIVVRPNLDAYYYGFYPTNCEPIDRILGTVAYAGKCYHHTEDWEDKNSEGVSPIDNIQAAAIEAADTIASLRKQLEDAREALADNHLLVSDGHYKEAARAVLSALREPDEGMIEAGSRGGDVPYAAEVWQAMIDQALKG